MNKLTLQESHDRLYKELLDLVKCIRDGELGDYSPLMDEIFDSEYAIKEAKKLVSKGNWWYSK